MQKMTNPQFLQTRFKNKFAFFYFKIQNCLPLPFLYTLPFITCVYFTGQIRADTSDPAMESGLGFQIHRFWCSFLIVKLVVWFTESCTLKGN